MRKRTACCNFCDFHNELRKGAIQLSTLLSLETLTHVAGPRPAQYGERRGEQGGSVGIRTERLENR